MQEYGKPIFKVPRHKWDLSVYERLSELDIFARMIYGEARGEPLEGKIGVAYVVNNRKLKNLREFGYNKVVDILLEDGQFEGLTKTEARIPTEKDPWEECLFVAEKYLEYDNPIGDCLWFFAKWYFEDLDNLCRKRRQVYFSNKCQTVIERKNIGEQVFFRIKGY